MINIELGETYGLGSFEEAVAAVETLRRRGFSDEEISGILERSKGELQVPKRKYYISMDGSITPLKEHLPNGVLVPDKRIPVSCAQCFCCHIGEKTGDWYCLANPKPLKLNESKVALGRYVYCPLIEVKGGGEDG